MGDTLLARCSYPAKPVRLLVNKTSFKKEKAIQKGKFANSMEIVKVSCWTILKYVDIWKGTFFL